MNRNVILILVVFFILTGCGYTTRGFVYEESSIIIEPVTNNIDITSEKRKSSDYYTFPILLENRLTNEVVNKFNIDGHLKVVSQDPNALKMTCAIKNYHKETLRYTNSDDVEEQRLRLYVHMKLVGSNGKVLKEKEVVGEATYFLSGPRQKSESSAQSDLIDDTARRISEAVIEEW